MLRSMAIVGLGSGDASSDNFARSTPGLDTRANGAPGRFRPLERSSTTIPRSWSWSCFRWQPPRAADKPLGAAIDGLASIYQTFYADNGTKAANALVTAASDRIDKFYPGSTS